MLHFVVHLRDCNMFKVHTTRGETLLIKQRYDTHFTL
jgi:hypothetical protein